MSRRQFHTPRRLEARRAAQKASNTIAVAATAHLTRLPAADNDYWKDLRRGQRWVWGGLLRFIDSCVRIGAPLSVVLAAIDAVRAYTLDAYGVVDPATLRLDSIPMRTAAAPELQRAA